MKDIEKEIHANAREATARQTFKAIVSQERPDIAIAIILRAIDEWYEKGFAHCGHQTKEALCDLERAVYVPDESSLSVKHAINHVKQALKA